MKNSFKKILLIFFWIFILVSILTIAFSIFAIHTFEKNIKMLDAVTIITGELK